MRAVLADPSADHLFVADDIPDPVAGPGQLLVRVRAAGLNRADLIARRGAYRRGADGTTSVEPFVAGGELAGEVVEVGEGVREWAPGDRVMGRGAGYAEFAVVSAREVLAVPEGLSWEQAGGFPTALFTMHDALVTNGGLVPGTSVLVNAATSGVGVVGVLLAAHLGASEVLATSRSAAKLAVLNSFVGTLPCPLIAIDTSTTDFVGVARDKPRRGVDVIVDNVGASVLAGNLAAVAIGGRIVQVGRLGGRTSEIDLDELARKRITLVGVTFRTRTLDEVAAVVAAARRDTAHLLERIAPRIERTFSLTDAAAAQEALAMNAHVGKIVLVP